MSLTPKPPNYRARRTWQNEVRARGEIPECGREACHEPADPAWVGSGTGVELLYCAGCAREINRYTPGTCRPERADLAHVDYTISIDHGNGRDEGIVSTWQNGELISVRPFNEPDPEPLLAAATTGIAMQAALDSIAATAAPPAEPTLNRAQRRARGDYQRADATVRRIR